MLFSRPAQEDISLIGNELNYNQRCHQQDCN